MIHTHKPEVDLRGVVGVAVQVESSNIEEAFISTQHTYFTHMNESLNLFWRTCILCLPQIPIPQIDTLNNQKKSNCEKLQG